MHFGAIVKKNDLLGIADSPSEASVDRLSRSFPSQLVPCDIYAEPAITGGAFNFIT